MTGSDFNEAQGTGEVRGREGGKRPAELPSVLRVVRVSLVDERVELGIAPDEGHGEPEPT